MPDVSVPPTATRPRRPPAPAQPLTVDIVVRARGSQISRTVSTLHFEDGGVTHRRTVADPVFDELLTVAMLERGRERPASKPWRRLAKLYDTPISDLELPNDVVRRLQRAHVTALSDVVLETQRALRDSAQLSTRQLAFVNAAVTEQITELLRSVTASALHGLDELMRSSESEEADWWPGDELASKRDAILRFGSGDALTAEGVRRRLRLKTRQGVSRRRRTGALLGLPLGPRDWRYPRWQFSTARPDQLVPGLGTILRAAPRSDPWAIAQLLTSAQSALAGAIPIEALREPDRADEVVQRVLGLVDSRFGSDEQE